MSVPAPKKKKLKKPMCPYQEHGECHDQSNINPFEMACIKAPKGDYSQTVMVMGQGWICESCAQPFFEVRQ